MLYFFNNIVTRIRR